MQRLLKETAEVAAELQRIDGTQAEIPHYSQIEEAACKTGQELAQFIQQVRIENIALTQGPQSPCPTCGDVCKVSHPRRKVKSIAGSVEIMEPKAHCPRCRRDFFPSASPTRSRGTRTHTKARCGDLRERSAGCEKQWSVEEQTTMCIGV